MPTHLDKRPLELLIQATPKQVEDALDAAGFEGLRIVVQSFNTSPPGRTYRRGSVSHIASQAGYPPNIDIGTLKNAINVKPRGQFTRVISTGSVAEAVYMEFGTRKIAKRPFMTPMSVQLRGMLPEIFTRILKL